MAESSTPETSKNVRESGGDGKMVVFTKLALRTLSSLFAIVVMGLIADRLEKSYPTGDVCIFGLTFEIENFVVTKTNYGAKNACRYGIAMGIITLVFAIIFVALDILLFFRGTGSPVTKKLLSFGDLVCSCLFAILWMVAFVYFLEKWNKAGPKNVEVDGDKMDDRATAVEATIAFSLINGVIWAVLAIIAGFRVRRFSS